MALLLFFSQSSPFFTILYPQPKKTTPISELKIKAYNLTVMTTPPKLSCKNEKGSNPKRLIIRKSKEKIVIKIKTHRTMMPLSLAVSICLYVCIYILVSMYVSIGLGRWGPDTETTCMSVQLETRLLETEEFQLLQLGND